MTEIKTQSHEDSSNQSTENKVLHFMGKYAFILNNKQYEKVAFSDIMWITAERSYCEIVKVGGSKFIISFPMGHVEPLLPPDDFIRIHRSYILNLKFVDSLIGNCLKIGDNRFTIGREYREKVLSHFIFLGIRRR